MLTKLKVEDKTYSYWNFQNQSSRLNNTTDVSSLTTPSAKTKLYKKGVTFLLNTCKVHTESVAENIAPSAVKLNMQE